MPVDPKDRIKKFYNDYLNSPNYKSRLKGMGYNNPNQVIKDRLKQLNATDVVNAPGIGSQFIAKNSKGKPVITYDSDQAKKYLLDSTQILAHEYSHAAGSFGNEWMANNKKTNNLTLNPREVRQIENRNQLSKIPEDRFNALDNYSKGEIQHDINAQEGKADIDSLRYLMKRDKLYDTGTQKFTQDHLNKAKKKYTGQGLGTQRLFENFKDKDLIYLMNNIASTDNEDTPTVAAYGGTVKDTNMKNKLQKYGYGDIIGDPIKPKNARKVDAVPQGYIPLDGVDNYYHNPLANKQTLDRATPTFGKQGGDSYNKKIIEMLGQGHSIDDLVNNKYGTKEGLEPFKSYYKAPTDDFVYIEPKPKQPAYMTKQMDDRVYYPNKQAAGDYSFNVLQGDITNPQSNSSTVSYRPIDKLGKPTGDYYEGIPSGEWTNTLGGNEGFTDEKLKAWSKYKVNPTAKMATGGQVGTDIWSNLAKQAPELLDGIMGLLDNNSYSNQPIVNASTIRNMATPYSNKMAFGGSIDDLDEDQLAQLQEEADSQGITIEEAFDNMNQDQGDEESTENTPDNENQEDDNTNVLDSFINDRGEYAYGGRTKRKIEVEGQEVIKTPDGQVGKVHGPSHEKGGVDVAVPEGSEVFSKRLKIEGKSMAIRKLNREKQLSKIKSLMDKDPHNQLLKNTQARTIETLGNEDKQDMMLQKIASKIYAPPQENLHPEKKYAYGDEVGNPLEDFLNALNGTQPSPSARVPYKVPGYANEIPRTLTPSPIIANNPITDPARFPTWDNHNVKSNDSNLMGENLTAGDYVGMAGTAFGAVAPIINTMNNRRATRPNINRFKGFGHDAIDANDTAQDYVAGVKSSDMADIDTSANTSYERNANSASSVNTLRALDASTDFQKNKSRRNVSDSFSKAMMAILGQRGQLTNIRDYREAAGQTQTDTENKADTDNYYSNMAANIGNIGTSIQNEGRNLNISHGNKVDANLISQLGEHNLEFNKYGRIVTKKV